MYCKALILAALTATPALAQRNFYFVLGSGNPVTTQRLDPLLSPGGVSNHVHSVVGGNAFGPTMDYATTQTSTCSTISVKADKSNYWMPSLYFHAKNGSFIRVPEKPDHRIYYKYGTGGNAPDLERSEFPKGFRMITGNAMARSDNGDMGSPGSQMKWQCHSGSNAQDTGFPKGFTDCDAYGFAVSIRFPSCWNGKDFDASAPRAHMAFPINKDGLAGCNAPFNVKRFPEIFVEYYFNIKQFNGEYGANDVPWVLSQGDPTGYGFHVDFLNGWEEGVLQKAMKTCNVGNTAYPLDSPECFGAGSLYDDNTKNTCRVKQMVNEDIGIQVQGGIAATDNGGVKGGVLSALPGCNPIQQGPGDATPRSGCGAPTTLSGVVNIVPKTPSKIGSSVTGGQASSSAAGKVAVSSTKSATTLAQVATPVSQKLSTTASASSPAQTFTQSSGSTGSTGTGKTIKVSSGATWVDSGCWTDKVNPRSLGTNPEWWGVQISGTNCADHCDKIGASMSGAENGGQCFCGSSLKQSTSADSSKCSAACNGDKSQKCGGPGFLSVYKKSSAKKPRSHRHMGKHQPIVS